MSSAVSPVDLYNTSTAYYAPATITTTGKHVYVSGQVGASSDSIVPSDYASQIHLALYNLRRVIVAANASVKDIAKLTIFIVNYNPADRKHTRPVMRFLGGHRPAITLVPVPQLAVSSWLFEIDAVLSVATSQIPQMFPATKTAVDVIIIGAGLAGLTAAHEILGSGYTCLIIEARDRVGGKTWSYELEGGSGVVDLGAAWINDVGQSKMYALAKRYKADLIEQNTLGNCVLEDSDGERSEFPYGEVPMFEEETRKHLVEIRDMVEADCQAVDSWVPKDSSLDSLTFEAYLKSRNASPIAIKTAAVWTRAMLGQDPSDISALFFLNYCKSGGGLLAMRSDRKGGGQHLRVRQGTQLFAKGLASDLPETTIILSTPVQAITQARRQQVLVQASSTTYSARKIISTVPSPTLKKITFNPALPQEKQAWSTSTGYGYYCKAMMQFSSPFWVEKGFCGLAQSFVGPASVVRDTSSPQDNKHILTCFMASDSGKTWSLLPQQDREQTLIAQLQKLYDVHDLQQSFIRLHSYEWADDEYSGRGCPSVSLTPGVLGNVGGDALRRPWKDIHFAGTETAGEWQGYMEGAVRSGERAASEVIEVLSAGVIARL